MAEEGKEKTMNREETSTEQKKDLTENENSNKYKSTETKVVEKKRWGDEEVDDDKVSSAVDVINSININEAATVDEPEIVLKSDNLIEPADSDESPIKAAGKLFLSGGSYSHFGLKNSRFGGAAFILDVAVAIAH